MTRMRLWLSILATVAASGAIAQETAPPQTQTQISVDINQYFPDNTSGFITPAYLRAVLHVMNASYVAAGSAPAQSLLGNVSLVSAAPTSIFVGQCDGASRALTFTPVTGFGCNLISAAGLSFPVAVGGTVDSGGIPYFSGPTAMASMPLGANVRTAFGAALGASSGLAGVSAANAFTGANSHTGQEAFIGTASNFAQTLANAVEPTTVGGAVSSPLNFDLSAQSVYFSTSNQVANWTVNFRFSAGTALNTAMATGQTVTAVLCALQGGSAYYNNVVQIDGSTLTSGTNLFWQGGSAPSSGNATGYDCYTYSILKTGSSTYIVLASQTQF